MTTKKVSRFYLGFPSTLVRGGERAEIRTSPQQDFMLEQLVIPNSIGMFFILHSVQAEGVELLALPIRASDLMMVDYSFSGRVRRGRLATLVVENTFAADLMFNATAIGASYES